MPRVNQAYRAYATYGTVGLQLVLSLCLGLFGGQWLDGKAGTAPVLAIVGTLLGIVAGFRSLYQAAMKMQAEAEIVHPDERPVPRLDDERPGDDDWKHPS